MFEKNENLVIHVVDHMTGEELMEVNNLPLISVTVGLWSLITW